MRIMILVSLCFLATAAPAGDLAKPPRAERRPVADTYQGEQVTDPYRWLEQDAPETRAWVEQQATFARRTLDAAPARKQIEARVRQVMRDFSSSYLFLQKRAGLWFALKLDPRKNQPVLVTLTRLDGKGKERILLDPNRLDPSGRTAIDFYEATENGGQLAVSLSRLGTESGDVHVYDVSTGRERTGDLVPRVNGGTAGGSVAWQKDGSGFFYTRYPRGQERPPEDRGFYQQVYFHSLGHPTAEDRYELGREFPRIGETTLESSPDGRWVLASVKNGDGGDVAHHLRAADGNWSTLAGVEDAIREAHFGLDGALYLRSLKGAERGRILRLVPGQPLASATVVAPEGKGSIEEFVATNTRLYVASILGGPEEVRVFDLRGNDLGTVSLPAVASATELTRTQAGDDAYVRVREYTRPTIWYRIPGGTMRAEATALRTRSGVDLSNLEVTREVAVSKDGTEVPMTIVRARNVPRDGTAPGILTGYGGFAISMSPRFMSRMAPWFEHGGVWVEANLRGGAEFGEAWHRGGALTHKQNVFDDFQACARALIARGWVAKDRLGIEGGSNGGLLMGAALTQAPELYRAVVSHVGVYDMLRVERGPNGAFNVTEFGSVTDPEQYRALKAYSPYHHVEDGKPYPSVLLFTGLNDPRVEPMNSFKMAARLQEATSSGHPVLLRVSDSGHGIGSSLEEAIGVQTDALAFFFTELGVPWSRPPSATPAR